MMDNGGGNRLAQTFGTYKERHDDMHRRFMDKYMNMREKETQEVNHTRQFMRAQPPAQSNKSTNKNKSYGSSNKMSNSTSSNEQSNSANANNKSGNFNTNGPTSAQDLLQGTHKRTFDQFNGNQSSNAKISRVNDQNKQQFNRTTSNTSYDVNSNVQPNVNPFQTNISKEKAKLSLPVTSMGISMTPKNTVDTPQVMKDVEKLLEQSDNMKLNAIKVESETASNTPPVTNADTGFDENIRYYGEFLKNEVKVEKDSPVTKSDINTKTQNTVTNPMSGTNPVQQIQSQQQQQQPQQQKMTNQPTLQTQQHQMANQTQLSNQQIPNQSQQIQNQPQQILNQTSSSNQQQQQLPIHTQQHQWQNNMKNVNQNTMMNRNVANTNRSSQQTINMNSSMQMLSGNLGQSNNQQQSLQQLSQPNFSNNSNMMNSAPLNMGVNSNNNSMNNPNVNMLNANNNLSMSTGMMPGNSTHLNAQPPSLPRLNQTPNVRQILDRVITNKDSNANQGQQINNQPYMPQQNHVGPYTNGKLQDFLKMKMKMKSNQQHPMSNQMMPQLPTPIPQNSFIYNNDVSMNNQQVNVNSMQAQQNGMGYFPPPYQMDNSNSQMFGNNSAGFFPQNMNKPAGKILQELSTQRQLNGMYNMHQNMSQQQMFNMGNKAPPRYTNQMSANMMNQAAIMNMNSNMNTSARLTHFSQPDSGNMGMPGPPGMKNQMGIRNMNALNRFPPPLSRNIIQNNNNMQNANNQMYDTNFMNQDMSSFSNMNNNTNNMMSTDHMMMRSRFLRMQQQQQMLSQQQQQQQQHQQQQQNNMHFQPMMNTDNNVQQHMLQQQSHVNNSNDSQNNNKNNSNQLSKSIHQQQYSGNFLPQQSSNSLQGNLQSTQMPNHTQHTSIQQTSQGNPLFPQTSLNNSSSVGTSITNNTLTDTSATLLENTSTVDGGADLLADENNFDEILENPSDQFDLIKMFS